MEPSKKENVWVNLVCNAVLPGILLTQLSKPERLGPVWGLVVALSVPLGYGVWDLWVRRRCNVFSVIGFASTLMTGVLGLLKTSALWIAVKEAAVPTILGLAIPLSLNTKQPLVRTLLFNDQVLDTGRIESAIDEKNNRIGFDALLRSASWTLAFSFLLSAVLNFGLARWLLKAEPGTPEFNAQLGRMSFLSWPVIVVPSVGIMIFALARLMKGIERLSGLGTDQIFQAQASGNQKQS